MWTSYKTTAFANISQKLKILQYNQYHLNWNKTTLMFLHKIGGFPQIDPEHK